MKFFYYLLKRLDWELIMKKKSIKYFLLAGTLFSSLTANAKLLSYGPVDQQSGYPAYYQDTEGNAFDICVPQTQEELSSGICLMLPGNLPTGQVPEVLPSNFSNEHFYWAASATTPINGGGVATLTIALEGGFPGLGKVIPGNQITFARIRLHLKNAPSSGTYIVEHPYGVMEFPNVKAGERIYSTEDVGLLCGFGDFSCALDGKIGPFLLPAVSPGGAKKDPLVLATGKYISDGVTPEFITGSPFNQNFFRITGPDIGGPGINVLQIDTFTVMGKIHDALIVNPTLVKRSSYKRDNLVGVQVDNFVQNLPSLGLIPDISASFTLPDANGNLATTGTLLEKDLSGNYWGQSAFGSPASVPAEVTIINNNNGAIAPSAILAGVHDEVKIESAIYTPSTKELAVTFSSSDLADPIARAFNFSGDGASLSLIDPVSGLPQMGVSTVNVPVLSQAQSTFSVKFQSSGVLRELFLTSSRGGTHHKSVEIGMISPPGAIAADDSASTLEDNSVVIDLTSNDRFIQSGSVSIVGNPVNGTVVVNPVDANGQTTVNYTPRANFFGSDVFTYTALGLDGVRSNLATVSVTVTPVNDAPVAVDDTALTIAGQPAITVNVLANDTDPDGLADINRTSLTIVQAPSVGTASVVNGAIVYTPPLTLAANTVANIIYRVSDFAGAASNNATLAVTVNRPDTLTVRSAVYTAKTRNWNVVGSSNLSLGQTITLVSGPVYSATAPVIGTAVVQANGTWSINLVNNVLPTSPATLSVKSSIGGLLQRVAVTVK